MKQVTALTEGQLSDYGLKQSKHFSKKQFDYPAKDVQDSVSETLAQTAFGINKLIKVKTEVKLKPITKALLVNFENAFLRKGFVTRIYGTVFPEQFTGLPAPGQPITPTAAYPLKIFDDFTGHNTYKRTVKVDYETFRSAEAFSDVDVFKEFVSQHSNKVSDAIAFEYNTVALVAFMSAFPSFTFTSESFLIPFLDSTNLKPTDKPVSDYYDTNKNEFWKTIIKKDVVGQIQTKHKNIRFYSCNYGGLPFTDKTVKKPTTVKKSTASEMKIYLSKENNDQKIKEGLSRFTCMLALTQAIREIGVSMTTKDTIYNMAYFDPYPESQPTEFYGHGISKPSSLLIAMNPEDYAFLRVNGGKEVRNTSNDGNYYIFLGDIEAAGTRIYAVDTIAPGHFQIQHEKAFLIVEILNSSYHMEFNYALGEQGGHHYFGKIAVQKYVPLVRGLPIGGFIPGNDSMLLGLQDFSANA